MISMTILHISDTHGLHHHLTNLILPKADILIHSGDITNSGTEQEVLDFLNWFIDLPNAHKIFVAGNHDTCLWDAERIEDLPENVHFLQDSSVEIGGAKFFGLGYNHDEMLIPKGTDYLITHEPPTMILDESSGIHWGNIKIRNRVQEIKPGYHLFGHAHESYGILKIDATIYSNAALLNDKMELVNNPRRFLLPVNNMGRLARAIMEEQEYGIHSNGKMIWEVKQ